MTKTLGSITCHTESARNHCPPRKKNCMPSGGCNCGVLSHHWALTELFPRGNILEKKSLLFNPPKVHIATCRRQHSTAQSCWINKSLSGQNYCYSCTKNTNQVEKEIAEKDLNPGHHKEKSAQFHTNPSISRQLSPTMGWQELCRSL